MHGKINNYIELSIIQKEAFIGSMLGDGHLSLNGKNALYRILRSIKDDSYLMYEASLFKNLLTQVSNFGIKYSSYFDKRTCQTYYSCYFATQSNSVFTEQHKAWYNLVDDKYIKTIPNDIKLSSLTMAHWFADDGTIKTPNLPYRFIINFATDGFTKEEVFFLKNLLIDRYNEKFNVCNKNNKFFISAYDSASRAIIKDIDPVFKLSRKRIWDTLDSRYYYNKPHKQISISDSFKNRKEILEKIISSYDCISMLELAKQLNYWVSSKNEPNYLLINKLLKPYIDSNIVYKETYPGTNMKLIKIIKSKRAREES